LHTPQPHLTNVVVAHVAGAIVALALVVSANVAVGIRGALRGRFGWQALHGNEDRAGAVGAGLAGGKVDGLQPRNAHGLQRAGLERSQPRLALGPAAVEAITLVDFIL
jgi:hypothetical protein